MQQALIVIEIKLFSCAHFALLASSERERAIGYLPQTGVRRTSCTRFHQAFQWNAHNRKASLTTTTTTQFSRLRVSPAHVCWKESNAAAAAARKGMAKLFVLLSKCTRGCPRVVATGCKVLHCAVGFSNTHTRCHFLRPVSMWSRACVFCFRNCRRCCCCYWAHILQSSFCQLGFATCNPLPRADGPSPHADEGGGWATRKR